MGHHGTFDRLSVDDGITTWECTDVPYVQDGLTFAVFLDHDTHVLGVGYEVRGFVDGTVRAHGTLDTVSEVLRDDRRVLRCDVSPPAQRTKQLKYQLDE